MLLERLQKYMARCGVASRRKCEEIIMKGRVKVDKKVQRELGTKIDPTKNIVEVDDKIIKIEENKIYIKLNKPVKYITTAKDERNRNTVLDLIDVKERIYPIGRLDYMTSGLLLLTNDGDIYNKIIHPRKEVEKTYIAKVRGTLTREEIEIFQNGVDIGGYITAKSNVKVIKKEGENSILEIKIHEGKNRQVRRMCEKINHPVIELKRVSIGEITLGNLNLGEYKELTLDELKYIRNL
ncbi:pseudouridine synthase [Hathewaya massiliensis]|uniref:pseudouridine synthase n=1 Tax=Hathewaya massiliensis TaxID=1964382 RepID=UPI001A9B45E2|nr:pseudouridine synthase [Hathewaya massiliensis]